MALTSSLPTLSEIWHLMYVETRHLLRWILLSFLTASIATAALGSAEAQQLPADRPSAGTVDEESAGPSADVIAQEAAAATEPVDEAEGDAVELPAILAERGELNLLALIVKGGFLMIPIGIMSLLVVAVVIERSIGMRRSRVLPPKLVRGLGKLADPPGSFDPRKAYRLCQQYPSAAANVIRAMLLKVGRPHSEVEHTVVEASQREAERMYANIRWLHLAAAVTPLLGLLGTVWGMIRAFHDTTILGPEQNKAEYLAEGIYVALVTTLAGLTVAIPAAVCAHYFEGRVQSLFHRIDELLFNLMPQIERYEGRVRFSSPADGAATKVSEEVVADHGERRPPLPAPK